MRETTCRPLAFFASVSPKRVSPRIAPCTSPSALSSALKSGEEIIAANGTTSTSSRVLSTSNPPAPMLVGTTRRLRLVGMRLPPHFCSPDEPRAAGRNPGTPAPHFATLMRATSAGRTLPRCERHRKGEETHESRENRDAALRRRLAQLQLRQAHDRRRHRRLERV